MFSILVYTPFLAFPHGGRNQNLSPLGEIRKGVKIIKNMTFFVADIRSIPLPAFRD
jgi:hypothetical protein